MRRPVTISLNDTEGSRRAEVRTFCIVGVMRGGTTAVAGVAQRIGLYLGDLASMDDNLEDQQFRLSRGGIGGIGGIVETVADRNARFPVWGWKHPQPYRYLGRIWRHLRNPRLVVVTRDPVANANGMISRGDAAQDDAMACVLGQTRRHLAFANRRQVPTLLVSYEKLLMAPERTIDDMARFLDLSPTRDMVDAAQRFVLPGWYQPADPGRLTLRQKLGHTRALWLTRR